MRLLASTGVLAFVAMGSAPLEPPVCKPVAFLYGAAPAPALAAAVCMDCEMGVRMLIFAVGVYFVRYYLTD